MFLKLQGRWVQWALFACALGLMAFGLFFFFSQQKLLHNITAAKLASVQKQADEIDVTEAERSLARAAALTATIAKLTADQLANSQTYGLLKEGVASTLKPFLDHADIAAIEVTDMGDRPYASIWRGADGAEFRVDYAMPPAFADQYKLVVRSPAVANGETQGFIRVYIDNRTQALQAAAIKANKRSVAESEIQMLRESFRQTLMMQVLLLLVGVAFVMSFGRALSRYAITESRRRELASFNQTLEQRVQERTQALENAAQLNQRINQELRSSQDELLAKIETLRQRDEDLRHLAFHDALTGLPNRALLLDRMGQALAMAQRQQQQRAIIFMDLDQFKAVNDSLGHDAGDALLKEVARRLKATLRKSDTSARVGGDEFVVLLNGDTDAKRCETVARKLLASLAAPMDLCGTVVQVGASMGLACFPAHANTPEELLKCADLALYEVKSSGRGALRLFDPAMASKSAQRLQMESDLRRAIAQGELRLFYQPKVSLRTMEFMGVEALVRWQHPARGLVPPVEFIALAEASGLIVPLGDWVLDEACRQSAAWRAQGLGAIRIAVNISAHQMQRDGFVDRFFALTQQHGVLPADLEVELTESAIMADPTKSADVFAALRNIGVVVAMDDFGTGYSSLSCLRQLPIDVLKIDRSFVMNACQDKNAAEIVRMIIGLAETLRLDVVAEGVETELQADFLRACGCTIAQGYLYAKPQPADVFEKWLRSRRHGLQVVPPQPAPEQDVVLLNAEH